jgi:hypothetical protein
MRHIRTILRMEKTESEDGEGANHEDEAFMTQF